MPPVSRKPSEVATVRPRVKLWIAAGTESVLCGGLCQILRAVESTGSIKRAADEVDRSYRFIWSRIKQAEEALGHKLVETQVGGRDEKRSRLTPLASDLLQDYEAARSEVCRIVDQTFAEHLNETLRRHGLTCRS